MKTFWRAVRSSDIFNLYLILNPSGKKDIKKEKFITFVYFIVFSAKIIEDCIKNRIKNVLTLRRTSKKIKM